MSGKNRRFSTVAVSHFWAVACSSPFFSTVLRPVKSCTQTGTKPLYNVTAIFCSSSLGDCSTRDLSPRSVSGEENRPPGRFAGRFHRVGTWRLPRLRQFHAHRDG